MAPVLRCVAFAALFGPGWAVPGTASIPVKLQTTPLLERRAEGVKSVTLINNQDDFSNRFYEIEVEFGSPAQNLSLFLNTRSSDTWAADFVPENSTTFVNGSFGSTEVSYGDPTTIPSSVEKVQLDYFEDIFQVAGVTIPKQRFGFATKGPDGYPRGGAFSIGPNLQLGYGAGKPFNSVVDNMVAQGVIASRTYSVDLRAFDDPKGVLLFGGADAGRFKGDLVKRPLVKDELDTWAPSIVLTGMGQTSSNGTIESYPVNPADSIFTLDTANQYMRLRHSFVDPLLRDMGAINDGNDQYTAPCSLRDGPGSWDFQFGDATIKIPYKHVILDAVLEDGSDYCVVAILVTWKGQLVLGGPFFQSAYLSYDFDNQEVGLAQPADCGSNVVSFGSGVNAIPKLTGCTSESDVSTVVPQTQSSTPKNEGASTAVPTQSGVPHKLPNTKGSPTAAASAVATEHPTTGTSQTSTSTLYETRVFTITACPSTVQNCPVGHVTTEVSTMVTTWCPEVDGHTTSATIGPLAAATTSLRRSVLTSNTTLSSRPTVLTSNAPATSLRPAVLGGIVLISLIAVVFFLI